MPGKSQVGAGVEAFDNGEDFLCAVRDDQVITIAESGAQAITMITPNGLHLVEPSDLGADGRSFSLTRTRTPSPAPRRR